MAIQSTEIFPETIYININEVISVDHLKPVFYEATSSKQLIHLFPETTSKDTLWMSSLLAQTCSCYKHS